jgi:signal transduction histidine kinase
MATWFGLAAVVVTAIPVLVNSDISDDANAPMVVWWIAYAVFVFAVGLDVWHHEGAAPVWLDEKAQLAVLAGSGTVAFLVYPLGVTPILLVIVAIYAAFILSPTATRNLIIGQMILIGVGEWLGTRSAAETILFVAVYGAFQAFAALMVHSRQNEARAHEQLAAAHTELRASSALLAETSRTSERLRIARDLHDLIGHQLTALSLELEVVSHHAEGDARAHAVKARDIAKALLADVRSAVGELRTGAPGLERPLRTLVEGLTQVDIDLTVREDVDIDEQLAMTVVRSVQEIITNTLRHADATRLSIDVTAERNGVTVHAHDNGRGAKAVVPGHGLEGMRERVEGCGGRLALRSSEGQGFSVTTWIPVA